MLRSTIWSMCLNGALSALTVAIFSAPASAGIVITATSEVALTDTMAIVTYNLYGGSDTEDLQGVSSYRIDVDLGSIATYLATPLTIDSVAFANPSGTDTTSVWATPGPAAAFSRFGGSPGGVLGNIVTFRGDVGDPFRGNVMVSEHSATAPHRLGTIVMEFWRPIDADLDLSLTPIDALFQSYDLKVDGGITTLSPTVSGTDFVVASVSVVPEPTSAWLILSALGASVLRRRAR